ncbi:hypothetical protein [Brevibacillus formosus]|uniref:hypothetical protein n=1 Tax=Brevibacillus formosus TaxID=54913 RepID=UPI003F1B07C7
MENRLFLIFQLELAAAMTVSVSSTGRRTFTFPMTLFNRVFQTRVTQPGGRTGRIRKGNFRGNYKYVQPLTKKELNSIKVVRPAGWNKRNSR